MRRLFLFILILTLALPSSVFADSYEVFTEEQSILTAADYSGSVSAECYVLTDALTGEIISSRNANVRKPIASTTKVATALVALENASLDEVVTVDAQSVGIEGSSIYLYKGEKLTMSDLLYALMLESANDAAVCIARHISGSVEAFAELMNAKAAELGLKNTHFMNPHGLHDDNHYSTAADMAVLLKCALENEMFEKIISTKTYKIPLSKTDGYRFLSNHNKLLRIYEDCIGGKTGYTKTAGRCLVSAARRDGATLIMVTLNAPNDWQDHKRMLDYGFSLYTSVPLATQGSITYELSVVGGAAEKTLVRNIDEMTVSVRDPSKITTRTELPRFVYAPVEAIPYPYDMNSYTTLTSPAGRVLFYYDGKLIHEIYLYPTIAVSKAAVLPFYQRWWNSIWKKD